MKFLNVIGIDVSKKTLDLCLLSMGKKLMEQKIQNSTKAIKEAFKELEKNYGVCQENSIICMEHTGIYNNHVLSSLLNYRIYLESARVMKLSWGIQRGKNDRIDAERIARYAYKNHEELRLWEPTRDVVKQLKTLLSTRSRLLKAKSVLSNSLEETKEFKSRKEIAIEKQAVEPAIKSLKKQIKEIEKKIKETLNQDDQIKNLTKLVTSVEGVGIITAASVIADTNEFKRFKDAKKYACHVGVAPFEHTSGTTIRGKTRVSHFANKVLKTILHMAAVSAIQRGELKEYYERKRQEGKHKMAIINAVRNKIILRIFAVVRDGRKYEKNYQYGLA